MLNSPGSDLTVSAVIREHLLENKTNQNTTQNTSFLLIPNPPTAAISGALDLIGDAVGRRNQCVFCAPLQAAVPPHPPQLLMECFPSIGDVVSAALQRVDKQMQLGLQKLKTPFQVS